MMKLLCLLLALTSLVITAPSCKTSAMCQACDATTADKCTGCYNKGNDTTFNARALATNACANVITTAKVTGCKVYTSHSDGTTIGSQNCIQCTVAAEWMNIVQTASNASTTSVACATAAQDVSGCAAAMAICLQNVCHSDGASFTPYCGMCASGKMGTEASNVTGLGSVNCIDGTITNCLFYQVTDATASLNNCYSCGTGYAVASTLLTCTAYTTDANCRVLLADGACGECVTGYYWNGAICGLTALVSVLSTMSLAILALLN